jgi:hypothetical protein
VTVSASRFLPAPPSRAILASAAIDVVAVLIFSVLGGMIHHESLTWGRVMSTTTPFLIGLALGWGALITLHLHPRARSAAFFPITGTVLFGLLLRALAQGDRTPVSLVVVAVVVVTGLLLGWRSLDLLIRRRRKAGTLG